MESFRLVRTFYHYLAEIGSLYKAYGSRERVGPPLGVLEMSQLSFYRARRL